MNSVLDYHGQDSKEAPNFWSSGTGHALQFTTAFMLILFIDLLLYTSWMMEKFGDARRHGPLPGRAVLIFNVIGLAACCALPGLLRRPVRSWLEAGAGVAVLAASAIELVWLAVG